MMGLPHMEHMPFLNAQAVEEVRKGALDEMDSVVARL